MSSKKQRPEGWNPLLSLAPGENARLEFETWEAAVDFIRFNGVDSWFLRRYEILGEDPTVLAESGYRSRGTWAYLHFRRRQLVVDVSLDSRWKSMVELGCNDQCTPYKSTITRPSP